jgi:hypothetical protein
MAYGTVSITSGNQIKPGVSAFVAINPFASIGNNTSFQQASFKFNSKFSGVYRVIFSLKVSISTEIAFAQLFDADTDVAVGILHAVTGTTSFVGKFEDLFLSPARNYVLKCRTTGGVWEYNSLILGIESPIVTQQP